MTRLFKGFGFQEVTGLELGGFVIFLLGDALDGSCLRGSFFYGNFTLSFGFGTVFIYLIGLIGLVLVRVTVVEGTDKRFYVVQHPALEEIAVEGRLIVFVLIGDVDGLLAVKGGLLDYADGLLAVKGLLT